MRHLSSISMLLLSALSLAGCGGNVVLSSGEQGGGGAGGTTTTTTQICDGAESPLPVKSSLAVKDQGTGWLTVFLNTAPGGSCGAPDAMPVDCGGAQLVSIILSPDAQTPGTYVIGPSATTLYGYITTQTQVVGGCSTGSNDLAATLVLTSVDSTHVAGAICDNPEIHGTFDASICDSCLGTGESCTSDSQCCNDLCSPMYHKCDP